MLGALVGLAAGALGFAGQESANNANAAEAARNREFQREQAERQMSFQEGMSNTEMQRRVKDLEAAGLNPALAYGQGGASAPSGASGGGAQANVASAAGAGVSSALAAGQYLQSAATQATQREAVQAQADLTQAQADRTRLLQTAELYKLVAEERSSYSASAYQDLRYKLDSELLPFQIENLKRSAEASTASAAEAAERTKGYKPERQLREYQIPMARVMSTAADSEVIKRVAPYLGTAQAVRHLLMGR